MRYVLWILLMHLALYCSASNTQQGSAIRTSVPPKIDGLDDDECWKNCKPIEDFIQRLPLEGKPTKQKTQVFITYDDNAIYVLGKMYDAHPDSIFKESGIRDNFDLNADIFRFVLDPYQKMQDFFAFGVFASGVQFDNKYTDETFNAVWYSAVKINSDGWYAELKIPFSAFRFPKKDIQEWNMQITRTTKRTQEFDQWCLTPSGSSNPLAFFGKLKGLENIKTPLRLFFTPYISGYSTKFPNYDDNGNIIYNNEYLYNAGADIKYGIDNRFTLDITLLPDFGQAQSDAKVKNLGYQEIAYDENRPFFLEGTDLFAKDRLFYSRRVGQPLISNRSIQNNLKNGEVIISNPTQTKLINAAKLSGRTNNGLGIGIFNAITDNTYAIVRDSTNETHKILTSPLTNYNVVVLEQQLNNYSNVYFMNTSVMRNGDYKDADITSVGYSLSNKSNTYATDGLFNVSNLLYVNPTTKKTYDIKGFKYFVGVRKTSGNIQFGLSRTAIDPKFYSSDLGFQTINNTNTNNIYLSYILYKPKGIFRDANNTISFNHQTNYETKKMTYAELSTNLSATLMNYHVIFCGAGFTPWQTFDYFEPRTVGRFSKSLRYYYVYAGVNTDPRKKFGIELTQNTSNFIDRFRIDGYNTDLGLRYRFSNRFKIGFVFSFYYDPYNFGYTRTDETGIVYGGRKLKTFQNKLVLNYIIKTNMQLNLVARHYWNTGEYRGYFLLQNDGDFTTYDSPYNSNFSYNALNIDLTYTWIFSPGSSLILNVKKAIEDDNIFYGYNYRSNFERTIQAPQTTSISAKFLYFLDWQVVKRVLKH